MWNARLSAYRAELPDLAAQLDLFLSGSLPEGWEAKLPAFPADKPLATRQASGAVLDALVPAIPTLAGGSADLTPSNNTRAKSAVDVKAGDFAGSYLRFGIREHGMGAILNGLALHGFRPFGGTFLVFSDYMKGSIRLAALMEQPVVYVFTHDSIGLGEDGPTHQPVEQLTALRATPHLVVYRPADANETAAGWRVALGRGARPDGPHPDAAGASDPPADRRGPARRLRRLRRRRVQGDPHRLRLRAPPRPRGAEAPRGGRNPGPRRLDALARALPVAGRSVARIRPPARLPRPRRRGSRRHPLLDRDRRPRRNRRRSRPLRSLRPLPDRLREARPHRGGAGRRSRGRRRPICSTSRVRSTFYTLRRRRV